MPLPLYKDSQNKKKFPFSLPRSSTSKIQSIIGIAAGKGGVGKSAITVNLALSLQALGLQVGILDADIYGPSIRKMLPEKQAPLQIGDFIEPAVCHKGIKTISMAYFQPAQEASAVRAPIVNKLIIHFLNHILWGKLDVLLIDFPPGTGDIQLTLSQQAQLTGAIIVTTPQEIALIDVRKTLAFFDQVKIPIIGVVENMSYYQAEQESEKIYFFGKEGGIKLAEHSKVPFLGQIPLDPIVGQCADRGQSLFEKDANVQKPITKAFTVFTQNVQDQMSQIKLERMKGLGSFQLIWQEMEENE